MLVNNKEIQELKKQELAEGKEMEWYDALFNMRAFCYIKPNRFKHSSGYRCFEVGYLTVSEDGKRMKEKLVLNYYSDHIQLYDYSHSRLQPNLDLLLDGYIRIFPRENQKLWWVSMDFVVSSAQIKVMTDDVEKFRVDNGL